VTLSPWPRGRPGIDGSQDYRILLTRAPADPAIRRTGARQRAPSARKSSDPV